MLPPTSGRATVAGYDITTEGARVRRVMGAALQDVALDPQLTGREHLRLQGALEGLARLDRNHRTEELLDRVGLTDAADRRTEGYSGGMKRRLDLALALVHRPIVLFLDEPTTGLDPQSRAGLWEEVWRLARDEGVTVFLTTQYLEEADALAARVGIIDGGRIVAEGTPAALKAQIGRPKLELRPCDAAQLAPAERVLGQFGTSLPAPAGMCAVRLTGANVGITDVVRALDAAGIAVDDLQLHAPTLDDVFIAKTGHQLEGAAAAATP